MEQIEVTARFNLDGKVFPLNFTWRGKTYWVESTGRRWRDEHGLHVLTMVPGGTVYDLVFNQSEGIWFLRQTGPDRSMA